MRKTLFLGIGFLCAVLSIGLACNLPNQISQVRGTALSIATDVQQGRDFLATARAITTAVGGSGLVQTAQAVATELGESGFLETARAYATEEGSALLVTARAIATAEGPALRQTAEALATRAALTMGEAPADIPLVEGERGNFIASGQLVTYFTSQTFQQVVDFYRTQMPANGWSALEPGTVVTPSTAVLSFTKPDRFASITLTLNPLDNQTIVVITIRDQ